MTNGIWHTFTVLIKLDEFAVFISRSGKLREKRITEKTKTNNKVRVIDKHLPLDTKPPQCGLEFVTFFYR